MSVLVDTVVMEGDQFQLSRDTIYNQSYRRSERVLPPIQFHQIPSIALRDASKLQPRKFPIEPIGPHRHWERIAEGLHHKTRWAFVLPWRNSSFATSSAHRATLLLKKAEEIKEPEDKLSGSDDVLLNEVLDDLCNSFYWSTTNERFQHNAHLPISEINPDVAVMEQNYNSMMMRPRILEERPHRWQKIACVWDRCQPRIDFGRKATTNEYEWKRQNLVDNHPVSKEEVHTRCEGESKSPTRTLVRQCPGYAGFLPRAPIKYQPLKEDSNRDVMSTKSSAYRPLPLNRRSVYSHKGPLSRTVTLTYPYNPYNKVESLAYCKNDVSSKW